MRESSSELDALQARTQLLGTAAVIPSLEASLQQLENALSALLGRTPGEVDDILRGQGRGDHDSAVLDRHPACRQGELDKAVGLPDVLALQEVFGGESRDLTGYRGLETGGVEEGDGIDTRDPAAQPLPDVLHSDADGCKNADPRDDDAAQVSGLAFR